VLVQFSAEAGDNILFDNNEVKQLLCQTLAINFWTVPDKKQ
jgi:hypothetical protein